MTPFSGGAAGIAGGSPDTGSPLHQAPMVAFDTELTGMDFKRDSIVSVGAVRMRGGRILPGQPFYRLVRPDSELKSQGVVVHGLTHSDLENAGPAARVLEEFTEFLGDAILIGHFVFIDLQFLNTAMRKSAGRTIGNPVVDTADVQAWLAEREESAAVEDPWEPSRREDLFRLARRYGVAVEKAHNALYDAYVTAQLMQRFLFLLRRNGVETVGDLLSIAGAGS